MTKAVALFSGGLDSTLAILTVLRQSIKVKALTFTHFAFDTPRRVSYRKNLATVAKTFGFDIEMRELSDRLIEIVKNPQFGYGRNMNPCIDCRILMLKEAKEFMKTTGADFIITGEVLGQRPMSQRTDTLNLIDREAGVKGYVVRPLSAKLLKITLPEENGIVNREVLYDFRGRSRKPQISLARDSGLKEYPAPAGGCLLTEPHYSFRLRDLLAHTSHPDLRDVSLLKLGRHFRLSPSCKIIVGRDKTDNEKISSLSSDDLLLKVEGYGSPLTVVTGKVTDEALRIAASICARYSDAKNNPKVEVKVSKGRTSFTMSVQPAKDDLIEIYRIGKRELVMRTTERIRVKSYLQTIRNFEAKNQEFPY